MPQLDAGDPSGLFFLLSLFYLLQVPNLRTTQCTYMALHLTSHTMHTATQLTFYPMHTAF